MDRELTHALANGGDLAIRETPSKLAQVLRTGAKWSPKAVGSLMDFGAQVLTGEDVGDAVIKTGGHLLVGGAGSALAGAAVGQMAIPIPGVGAVAGLVGATAGSMLFDWAYDNGLKEGIDKVGDAVSGAVGKLGSLFG